MALLLSLLFFVSAIFLYLQLRGKKSQKTNLPPSPPKLPIIGNLHQLGDLPYRSLRTLAEKHGPMMLLHLGQVPTLVISSAEMAEEILKTHDLVFASRPSLTAAKRLFYNCTNMGFSPYGEYWRQLRKIYAVELLSIKRVNSFRPIAEEEVGLMVERISQSCSKGEAANLKELVFSLSSGTITRFAIGKKYGGEGEKGRNKFADIGAENMKLQGEFFVGDYFPWLAWVDFLSGMEARLKKNFCKMDAFLDQVMDDHLNRREIMNSCDGFEQKDLVDVLLDVQKDSMLGSNLTRDNFKAIILDMFVGGTDSAAAIIEWAMAELIKCPDAMDKAQAEIRRVVGKKKKVEEDLNKFHYLKLIIKETMRLHPIGPLLAPREAATNVMIQGYHIPAKTRVFVNAWAIARDPKSWKNAEQFLPERFANTSVDFKGQDFQYIPFGAGRRGCPGMSFALNVVELALANLLYWFDWELPEGLSKEDLNMSEAFGLTVHMKSPFHLVPRHHFS